MDTVITLQEGGSLAPVIQMPGARSWESYISLQEVAERLGYSTRWVHDRIRHDALPTHQHRRGAQHRFRWSEVEAWWTAFRSRA